MRKEDYDFIKDKSGEFVDVLQCNNAASSRTPRGHQFPGAFMEVVSEINNDSRSDAPPPTTSPQPPELHYELIALYSAAQRSKCMPWP